LHRSEPEYFALETDSGVTEQEEWLDIRDLRAMS
jgi:hypothetical protein